MRSRSKARRSVKAAPARKPTVPVPGAPQLFDTIEAAAYIGMSVPFLAIGRQTGIMGNRTPPPPHLKLGRAVRYTKADLDQWLAERRVDHRARLAAANASVA